MSGHYETIDHDADTGLRIVAPTRAELFTLAARGLFDALVADLDTLAPTRTAAIALEAPTDGELLVDYLNELLFRFDAEHQIHAWPRVDTAGEGQLRAASGYLPIDWGRHRFHAEIKSATYHDLRFERRDGDWVAQVIFDL